jgi:DNA-directed RNA polymerase subunit beta
VDYNNRKSYANLPEILPVPNLIQTQMDSYAWFQREGLKELLTEVSPIRDFTDTRLELTFLNPNEGPNFNQPRYSFLPPKHSEEECRDRDLTYSSPLHVTAWLLIKDTGEWKEQDLFLGDFPNMTNNGTFIINGAERVVVSQLIRSPGVYFTVEEDLASGRDLCFAKMVPNRGAWLEFETNSKDVVSVKVDRKRKIPITTLIRSIGYGTDDELLDLFKGIDNNPDHHYLKTTIEREPLVRSEDQALIDFHRRLRPSDPSTLDNAKSFIHTLFFDHRRYDLGKVGRYKMNKRLGLNIPLDHRTLTKEDLLGVARYIVKVNNGVEKPDDIDHLGNRRVRTVGELVQNQLRVGFLRMERVVKERMSITEIESVTPSDLINIRPVSVTLKEFFGSSQLSQFMDQTNPLAELTHKRRLSALGPGGLSRERAGFDVRDVHHSHYGRICPIETPEGPNIGLIGSLATYGRINQYGLIDQVGKE